ncbi:J domain-containing protein [Egibacter rhizosphaerae]|uniref:J domain-containing protein n=1 Tax=Egibacter rhizosphaerae TaxID=1670831 RepID=A0A411YKB4_9ACTN|nr:J domain-containing protein [Egibacter rhizosphaerae]QBI21620.1 J domain-containing protein [Egibacter rhizosphaerae]
MWDHYGLLGVSSRATHAEIRAAYLRLVREHHPDHRPDDPASEDKVRAANAAWEVLGDEDRRAAYDRLHAARAERSQKPGTHAGPRPTHARAVSTAYSAERERFQRQFSRTIFNYTLAAFIVGTVILLVTA